MNYISAILSFSDLQPYVLTFGDIYGRQTAYSLFIIMFNRHRMDKQIFGLLYLFSFLKALC